jgi:integration host factor subunit alpha
MSEPVSDTSARLSEQLLEDQQAAGIRRTITRVDLLERVHAVSPGLSRAETRDVFEMTLAEITSALARGESVRLRAFGIFAVRHKRARVGRNPRTGEEAAITPRRVLTFKPSSALVDELNGR